MKFLTVRTFDSAVEAHLLKTKLESEGIPCVLFDEHLVNMNPLYSVAVGGIKLKIRESDWEKAAVILEEIEEQPWRDEKEDAIKCPRCGSEELYANFKSMKGIKGILTAIVSFLLAVFPFYYKTVYKCKNCGAEFRSV